MKDFIIEGVDRLGKDSLIMNLQHKLGFFQEIHYQKPKLLDSLYSSKKLNDFDAKVHALKEYQAQSFIHMFQLLSQPGRHIMNRGHLGECVYAPRYRNYDGSYVFDIERSWVNAGSSFVNTTLLILLTTSDFSFIQDDGLSFDFAKKEEEQKDFIKAFNRSAIKNKLMIDVSNGEGGFRHFRDIVNEVINAWEHGTS